MTEEPIQNRDQLQTPILFLIFNRAHTTLEVFNRIREARPTRLYISGDGPREGRNEVDSVNATRAVATCVDWPCKVETLFRSKNLGCKRAVGEGISWFFEHEEQGIILEDDCVPDQSFFSFCDVLLKRYASDERVSVITGDNFQAGQRRGEPSASYYFSKYNHCWGWATWRRAWQYYQGDLPFWPEWSQSTDWREKTPDPVERRYWGKIFERAHAGQIDSWAYPWTASVWYHGGLTATPNVNLVTNIGFDDAATHTKSSELAFAFLENEPLTKIVHPTSIVRLLP